MRSLAWSTSLLAGAVLAGAAAQAHIPQGDPKSYFFIDAHTSRSRLTRVVNLSKVRDRLVDATNKGYVVRWVAGSSSSMNLLLSRGDAGPQSYEMVTASGEGRFLKALNEAAAQGFRVMPGGIKAFEEGGTFGGSTTTWIGLLRKERDAAPVTYSLVKGTREGEQALADSASRGHRLVAILGRQGMIGATTLLVFEDSEQKAGSPSLAGRVDYRIIATGRTSSLQKDVNAAAVEGFEVIAAGFGYMTVLMARDRGVTSSEIEYRVLAMVRIPTALKELQAAGVEGYRIRAASENGSEAVFILQRRSGAPRYDYRLERLEEETASRMLSDAEAEGYRVVQLLNDIVVLERAIGS